MSQSTEKMVDCIFCDIVANRVEASFIYRDSRVCAIMDIQPVNPGHVLVIPNKHAAYLSDLDEEIGAHMFRIANQIAKAIRKSEIKCEGINFFLADGEAAGQEIFHVHLHVFPRFCGDGFGLKFGPEYFQQTNRSELNEVAEKMLRVFDFPTDT